MKKIRKVNRVMKISALLSLAFACTVSASTYGQNYKLSMNKQDCSISEVLKEIEKNSEYTFFLNDNQVNVNRKTSVKAASGGYGLTAVGFSVWHVIRSDILCGFPVPVA